MLQEFLEGVGQECTSQRSATSITFCVWSRVYVPYKCICLSYRILLHVDISRRGSCCYREAQTRRQSTCGEVTQSIYYPWPAMLLQCDLLRSSIVIKGTTRKYIHVHVHVYMYMFYR